jgi:hypothetical protein
MKLKGAPTLEAADAAPVMVGAMDSPKDALPPLAKSSQPDRSPPYWRPPPYWLRAVELVVPLGKVTGISRAGPELVMVTEPFVSDALT